ncbi:MAG: type II toxin-antitoxin system HicA family toxin [Pirellulales bacterium]|nr:type II toxin-antitoxin system HicA family toxin [Pirellulales bacterium]
MKPVSGKRMCRILERYGWICKRVKGSHHAYQKPGTPKTIIVPVHANKDLKPGTQQAIMKDAGLIDSDL